VTLEPNSEEGVDQLLDRLRDLDRSLRPLSSLQTAARLGESIENDLLARIASLISTKPVVRRANDRRRSRQCGEILRDAMKLVERDPVEMLDLRSMSKATGLSPRTLQRTFQTEYGLCPQEWLRVERLNRVREDLLDAQKSYSVTHMATRWGFFHLSRFSQYYRELFGERPSETLARRAAAQRDSKTELATTFAERASN
jgi:transcriptional regulator GlxA family with amidase domain